MPGHPGESIAEGLDLACDASICIVCKLRLATALVLHAERASGMCAKIMTLCLEEDGLDTIGAGAPQCVVAVQDGVVENRALQQPCAVQVVAVNQLLAECHA